MNAARPFDPQDPLAPAVDGKWNQEVAQEVGVQNAGIINGNERLHVGSLGLPRQLFVIKARVLR